MKCKRCGKEIGEKTGHLPLFGEEKAEICIFCVKPEENPEERCIITGKLPTAQYKELQAILASGDPRAYQDWVNKWWAFKL